MSDTAPLIQFSDATIANGETPVIFDFNFTVRQGDFIYVTGKVGSGKTSIIKTIIAENRLFGGKGSVCGFDLGTLREKDIPHLRRKLGVVFQDFQLLMDRDVHDNLEFVLKCTGWKSGQAAEKRINEVLNAVDMTRKSHKMPYQLSGGEQQRIAIARSLLNIPLVILADEPTGNLDSETSAGIMELIRRINSLGTAVVMVTHNESIVKQYPGRIFVCENEHCCEQI